MRRKRNSYMSSVSRYVFLLIIAVLSLFPFYWMLNLSLQSEADVLQYPPMAFPQNFVWENFLTVFRTHSLTVYFLNSVIVSVVETIIITTVSTLAAYGLCIMNGRFKKVVMIFCLSVNFIPFEVLMAFNYRLMIKLSLTDTLIAIMLPFFCNFFYTLIIYDAFLSIPMSIYISAKINGASDNKFLFKIALPYIKSTVAFVALLSFVSSWNAFIWPALVTNADACRTLPFGIYNYMSDIGSRKELVMAIFVVMQIPVIAVFSLSRNIFIKGFKRRLSND